MSCSLTPTRLSFMSAFHRVSNVFSVRVTHPSHDFVVGFGSDGPGVTTVWAFLGAAIVDFVGSVDSGDLAG